MSSKSKIKGNRFENEVLRILRNNGFESFKTIGSGNSKDEFGDIIIKLDDNTRVILELKRYKKISRKQLENFYEKLQRQVYEYYNITGFSVFGYLVFKEDYRDIMVFDGECFFYIDNFFKKLTGGVL